MTFEIGGAVYRDRRSIGSIAAVLLWVIACLGAPVAAAGECAPVEDAIVQAGLAQRIAAEDVRAFYEDAEGACVWDPASAHLLIETLRSAGEHGLDPLLFHAEQLSDIPSDDPFRAAERDVLLTDAALKYGVALTRGLSAEKQAAIDLPVGSLANSDVIGRLGDALRRGTLSAWLNGLPPDTDAYRQLQGALRTYRSIAEAGGWGLVPASLAGKRKSKYLPLVRRRLAIEGDLALDNGSAVFDDELSQGIARFQSRTGLRSNGKLDAKTIERLNVSASERAAQIAVNLERLRAADRDIPATRVEVNAPAATAVLFRDGAIRLSMNAVVGAPGHDTPTLTSTIETIILNPTWTIPQSIIQNEIRPLLKRNPDYLTENRMYRLGDQIIQEPGPHNALGRIKFEFPNRYSVYLHDTPARKLFTDPERAQSHGCVRLERPLDLAVELLSGDPTWTREALEEAIREGSTRRIPLLEPMPVVITYQTAFVADDGQVNFRPDIYGLDTKLTLVLSERAASLRSASAQW